MGKIVISENVSLDGVQAMLLLDIRTVDDLALLTYEPLRE